MGRMAMLSGPAMFMDMGDVRAMGWARLMDAVVGMWTEEMFTGPVMVTGCCRPIPEVMLPRLICVAMVTALEEELELLLVLPPRLMLGPEEVTCVMEDELHTSLLSGRERTRKRKEKKKKRRKTGAWCV